jgi:phosphoribosylamine--glycine ligase
VRFLGIGDYVALGDMYLRLVRRGHDVKVYVDDEDARDDIMSGMLDFTSDWRQELDWVRAAGDEGIILFETASQGSVQRELRAAGYNVIGGSPIGTRLEEDRPFGQRIVREVMGLPTAAMHEFTSFDAGIAFVRERRGRWVVKLNGAGYASFRNYVGELDDGADVIATLAQHRNRWALEEQPSFVLMEHVEGIEMGVGAYFNGERFLEPACLDWEHKRFFPGDLGELTGEMGTLVTYRGYERLFEATLAKMAALLADDGYVGYINLNTIVNDQGIWPLEFTCRFGYPGFAILDALHDGEGWAEILHHMVTRRSLRFRTHPGYAVGVVLTVPPFPYALGYAELSKGAPISFRSDTTTDDLEQMHYGEVARRGEQLITAGTVGYIAVVTGRGVTAEVAQRDAYERVRKVAIPNVRYRCDIGDKFVRAERERLVALGYLP